jgi:hypothetical protein
MDLVSDFKTFLEGISPTQSHRADCQLGHMTLRARLNTDEDLAPILVSDFLQGSYRRGTAVRPKGQDRSDVDIVVVTKLDEQEYTPRAALEVFTPFMEKHYPGKWRPQGRSIGIELSYVSLDVVVTSAPSESEIGILESDAVTSDDNLEEARDWRLSPSWMKLSDRRLDGAALRMLEASMEAEWKASPLRIPDRETNQWESTHPLEQIRWTRDKNQSTGLHFLNVVKALKWWRLENYEKPKNPKGFPLERLVGECCPDGIGSVAEGVTLTLEAIVRDYATTVGAGQKPILPDYGVPEHDVFKRVEPQEFSAFYAQAREGAELARRALEAGTVSDSRAVWLELLGPVFPAPPVATEASAGGFQDPTRPARPLSTRFA